MGLLLVSPHLDDAPLGCGELLARSSGAQVVTVMAGIPDTDLPLTHYDVNSGFTSAHQAVTERRREDRRALSVLGAVPRHLDFLDCQYAMPNDLGEIIAALVGWFDAFPSDTVAIPVGIGHPDHETVARAARAALRNVAPRPIIAYEELPYRVLRPGAVEEALLGASIAEGLTYAFDPLEPARDGLVWKRAALACYRSQAWALDETCCVVPERYWHLDLRPEEK